MRAGADRADFCHFWRPEAAREGELALVGHSLAAKHQNRMFFERGTHRPIGGIVGRDIGKRDAAQFGGKARTQRDDVHRRILMDEVKRGGLAIKPLWEDTKMRSRMKTKVTTRTAPPRAKTPAEMNKLYAKLGKVIPV